MKLFKKKKPSQQYNIEEKLYSLNPDEIPSVPLQNQFIMARVIRVYDGDTCTVLYFVNETPTKMNIRIEGIDTPEIRSNSELEKQAGKLIRDILQYFLLEKIVLLKIYDWDKYGGRILGMIYYTFKGYEPYGQLSVKNFLLEKNYAKPYDGTTKKKGFDENELKDIIHKATLELQSFE